MAEIKLETRLVGSIKGNFFVPSYQRGYRWGEVEVERLLDDIYSIGHQSNKSYCIQPIVIRKMTDESYELIDGQQRLTTLYMIYKYMHGEIRAIKDAKFSITYQTREKSADFLSNIDTTLKEDNIDFWFMSNAYERIAKWFESKEDPATAIMHINGYFQEKVKLIWYEVGPDEDAIALFARLNIGKIPLTSAELIKAMFLSRDNLSAADSRNNSEDLNKERQQEISLQWDNIERALQNDRFWYFLTNKNGIGFQTRIDLLLDLMAGKTDGEKEKYFTYFQFDKKLKEMSLPKLWNEIQTTFLMLKDWYENHEFYHKIGYLIASGQYALADIYERSKQKTKKKFIGELDEMIRDSIKLKSGRNYSDLEYGKKQDEEDITNLLLLFNVESVRQNGEHTQWFPFDKFKFNNENRVAWSLEHIHAQQSESLRTQEAWKEWLTLQLPSVEALGGNEELAAEMKAVISSEKIIRETFEPIQAKVTELLSASGNVEYLHSISNLALLNCSDNAALNNSTFDVKRNAIIEMDKKGQYIPYCTKMVFLKYYTPSDKNQLHFWGAVDRISYIEAINRVLKDYLQEEITVESEEK